MTKLIIVFRYFATAPKNIQTFNLFSQKIFCARTMKVKAVQGEPPKRITVLSTGDQRAEK